MQTNKALLPVMSVQGKVDHPVMSGNGYRVGYDGYGRIPMATGGIIYNYKIGDSCRWGLPEITSSRVLA